MVSGGAEPIYVADSDEEREVEIDYSQIDRQDERGGNGGNLAEDAGEVRVKTEPMRRSMWPKARVDYYKLQDIEVSEVEVLEANLAAPVTPVKRRTMHKDESAYARTPVDEVLIQQVEEVDDVEIVSVVRNSGGQARTLSRSASSRRMRAEVVITTPSPRKRKRARSQST